MSKRKYKNSISYRFKNFIFPIFMLFFVIFSSIILISIRKKSLAYDAQYFYFVCVDSAKNENLLEKEKDLLKNLGGAGVIYKNDGTYYLVANVYLDVNSANEIKGNLKNYFQNIEVMKISTEKLSKKTIKKIKSNESLKTCVNYLFEFVKFYQDLQMKYLSGDITESKFLSKMIAKRLELERICDDIPLKDEFSKEVLNFAELFLLQMTNFLNNYYLTNEKQAYVCDYYVGYIVNYLEFYDSL